MNLLIDVGCVGRDNFEIDVVTHPVDNMDPDVKAHLEANYSSHLNARLRDPLTQTKALQLLLIEATKAEKAVIATRNIASSNATQVLQASFSNFKPPAITNVGAAAGTMVNASQAERTLSSNSPVGPFNWGWGHCLGCGSEEHRCLAVGGVIMCPHANRPGCKENDEENLKLLRMGKEKFEKWLGTGLPIPEGNSRKKRVRVGKPKWDKLGDTGKTSMVRGMLANQDHRNESKALVEQIKEEDGNQTPAAKKTSANVTVLPAIRVMNATAGDPPVLPVNLDGLLPHINFEVGDCHEDNYVTELGTLVDSGAGCTIGWQTYFELAFLNNPSILVKIYTCVGGEYSPITMHVIVDAEAGAATTDLPIAFKICTPYRCRDGSRLHMMVACGPGVSVNFVMSNGWLKTVGAVLDYAARELRVPMHDDLTVFPIIYRHPVKNVPSDTLARSPHQAAHSALPNTNIEGLLRCMVAHNPKSPWLEDARAMVTQLRSTASTARPPGTYQRLQFTRL